MTELCVSWGLVGQVLAGFGGGALVVLVVISGVALIELIKRDDT